MHRPFTAASLLVLLGACSSSVVVVPAEDASTDVSPDQVPPDVAPDQVTPDVSEDVRVPPDQPAVCTRTNDRAVFEVTTPAGAIVSCATLRPGTPAPAPASVRGVARVVDDSTFEVDTCLPDVGCRPSVYRVRVTAPGLSARAVTDGAFVELRYTFSYSFGCASSLSVAGVSSALPSGVPPLPPPDGGTGEDRIVADAGSGARPSVDAGFVADVPSAPDVGSAFDAGALPTDGGGPRPDGGGEAPRPPAGARLYLAVGDGSTEVLYDSVSIGRVRTGCGIAGGGASCGPVVPDLYQLQFRHAQRVGGPEVPMGATADWSIPINGGVQNLRVRNLRSFETGACDDYWNWAWWIANAN
jgi:hypothetical protein